jgi:hypothetical protein
VTEPSTEPVDPRTIWRQPMHPGGGRQDDSQSPFGDTAKTPADDSANNKKKERK